MNTQVLVGIVVVLVLLGGGFYFFSENDIDDAMHEDDVVMEEENMMEDEDSVMGQDGDTMMEGEEMMDLGDNMALGMGTYEAYAPEKLAKAEGGDVVLFFRASWCPTCRALDADIHSNKESIPEGVTILDVDYDNSTELKQKYGVTYQHTLVQVDANGEMITKWSSSPTLKALTAEII